MARKRSGARRATFSLLAVLLVTSYTLYALTQPLPALPARQVWHFSRSPQPVSLWWPTYGAAAVGAVGYGVLAAHGGRTPIPTASVIKVLTALTVLHERPLAPNEAGPTITISSADVASYNKFANEGGSVVRVQIGETLTERQALEALLLPSANNIAETLARWAFGSLDTYMTFANRDALSLGMGHTTITDPSGFDASTVSTPSDLVLLGEAGMSDPTIAQIVGESSATIPVQGPVHNVNFLLGQNGIDGIKTGNNDTDPGCFLIATKYSIGNQQLTLVGVVMNAANVADAMRDARTLVMDAGKGFAAVHVVSTGDVIAQYAVPWAGKVDAVAASDIDVVVWDNSLTDTSIAAKPIDAAEPTNTAAGALTVHNSQLAAQPMAQLILKAALPAPTIWWRLAHPR